MTTYNALQPALMPRSARRLRSGLPAAPPSLGQVWPRDLPGRLFLTEPLAEAWHVVGAAGEPAFLNGWSNYGSGWAVAAFYKMRERVYLKGLVTAGTIGTEVFILPAGYRPAAGEGPLTVPALFQGGYAASLYIYSDGKVVSPSAGGAGQFIYLDSVTFRAG